MPVPQTESSSASVASHTKLDAALAAAERRFANDPERAELIARTRRFKASWIDLAEGLNAAQRNQRYTAWGYASFEEYYRKELHLKESTVTKLVGSYAFLRKSAPEVLERDGVEQEIPSIQSLDFLRKAEEAAQAGQVPADLLAEVRRAVIDDNLSMGKVAKQFKETLFPSDIEVEKQKRRKEAVKLAQKLIDVLQVLEGSVDPGLIEQVEQAISNLLSAVPAEPEKAADKDNGGAAAAA